ncbi:Eco57I restriction-modification methylase domain-containing protein [Streptomyces sp. SPB074]|uniref:Eco57I restriction-modification methylase domain-containing protein n=1 Tax=Streptomyces sp. (strain SPB074) TaxID=465543 RepID=UPI00017F13C6|nr:N-6 DNA methylase [Streptomyces sp. SPB074]EDY42923.1 modification methylase [Streptomyces sp. SPB074]
MRTRDEVSDDKLRGGFYSPDVLVELCIRRSAELLEGRSGLSVLEPSAGDGAFLRGIRRSDVAACVERVEAVEIFAEEAAKAADVLRSMDVRGHVANENVLEWSQGRAPEFDWVLANPPYVRFQFISDEDKQRAKEISSGLGATGSSVSNLWIPVFLLSLSKLRDGGVFSVILPTEFLTGISANAVRNWLLAHATDLTIDLFEPGSFPTVLQEVLILSGRLSKGADSGSVVRFHDHNGSVRSWSHRVATASGTWTSYLLPPEQNDALAAVQSIPAVGRLGDVARFSVSTVTGANGYFCVDSALLEDYGLEEWAIPLLPRARHAEGLIFTSEEQRDLADAGRPAWLLSFAATTSSPEAHGPARQYLDEGVRLKIPQRFKCRVREPWYRVPVVPAGDLLLSKRSNRYPRVISNHAKVVTTDTIYKGKILAGAPIAADDFTAAFHNSLTMLSAEIEGRSFGGGVLELVPSEVSTLRVPVVPGAAAELPELDKISRTHDDPEALIEATDKMLTRLIPELDTRTMGVLSDARHTLMDRRLQRTHTKFYG